MSQETGSGPSPEAKEAAYWSQELYGKHKERVAKDNDRIDELQKEIDAFDPDADPTSLETNDEFAWFLDNRCEGDAEWTEIRDNIGKLSDSIEQLDAITALTRDLGEPVAADSLRETLSSLRTKEISKKKAVKEEIKADAIADWPKYASKHRKAKIDYRDLVKNGSHAKEEEDAKVRMYIDMDHLREAAALAMKADIGELPEGDEVTDSQEK